MSEVQKLIQLRSNKKEISSNVHFQLFQFYKEDRKFNQYNCENQYLNSTIKQHFLNTYDDSDDEDEEDDDDEEEQEKKPIKSVKCFTMKLFGVLKTGETICVNINDYSPSFYIRLPKIIYSSTDKIDLLKKAIIKKMFDEAKTKCERYNIPFSKKTYISNLLKFDIVTKKKLYWFDNNTKYQFLHIKFKNMEGYHTCKRFFLDQNGKPKLFQVTPESKFEFQVYDGNIEPMLKFLHEQKISPAGWCNIKAGTFINRSSRERETTCNYEIVCNYKSVLPSDCKEVAPYVTASYDIECDSLHGDFPLAKKTYKKYARKIVEYVKSKNFDDGDDTTNIWIKKIIYTMFNIKKFYDDIDIVKIKKGGKIPNELTCNIVTDRISQVITTESIDNFQDKIEIIMNKSFPPLEGDFITMIGTTIRRGRDKIGGVIITLGGCDNIPGYTIIECDNEKTLIQRWITLVRQIDPDIITGYNINGFDYDYIYTRMLELKMEKKDEVIYPGIGRVHYQSRNNYHLKRMGSYYKCDKTSSAAMGVMENKVITTFGRINMDLMKVIRKTYMSLESYKLDSIAASFMNGKILNVKRLNEKELEFTVNSLDDFTENMYISCTNGKIWMSGKRKVYNIDWDNKKFIIKEDNIENDVKYKLWKKAKDDVPPKEIFRLQRGSDADRAIVAKYCIQDCNLVLDIDAKVENIAKAQAMANVCSVPLGYIFSRGQGIKLQSLVFKKCYEDNRLVKTLPQYISSADEVDGYEGAVVLEPKVGLYLDTPVSVLDYSSLYPSSIISENLSHDSIVWIRDYDINGNEIKDAFQGETTYENIEGYNYITVEYDRQGYDPLDTRKNRKKIKVGTRVCCFAQPKDQTKSIIPNILMDLLKKRKDTKKLMKKEKDPFKYNLLDAEQLAYKVTANSLYGQMGAKTSKVCFIPLAACTTSYGRKLLNYAKEGIETLYGRGNDKRCDAKYVYGDTDSVFVAFNPKDKDGNLLKGKEALKASIDLAVEAEKWLSNGLKKPHCLEYEKTFMPFVLLSKKRYVGEKYEFDLDKSKQTNMGVVLKRRDNAPIVKEVYGKMIDVLMIEKSVDKTITTIQDCLQKLIDGKYGNEYLTITKSLRDNYADPTRIAHKALADRIGVRDPGNKPKANDRIGFVYIDIPDKPGKKILQGDRVETPEFIKQNNLVPDYKFYITNQIMKPVLQVLALVVDQIDGYNKNAYLRKINAIMQDHTLHSTLRESKIQNVKETLVQQLVFEKYIKISQRRKKGPIHSFFKLAKK
jgi:DNA polymerase elongation subunit (family B)